MNLIQHILDDAQNRLVVLDRQAVLAEAAAIPANSEIPLVVVCDERGTAVGARRIEDDGQTVEAAVIRRALSTRSGARQTHVGAVSPRNADQQHDIGTGGEADDESVRYRPS